MSEQLQVNVVSAIGGGSQLLDVESSMLVRDLKEMVASQKKIPVQMVIMVSQGQQLDDLVTLEAAGVEEMDTIYLITRTEGGI